MAIQELNINRSVKQPTTAKHNRRPARGNASDRLYRLWAKMLNRCYVPTTDGYKYYGGKGITVCKRWRESCINFYEDMGEPPTDKHTLDRKDGKKNYTPQNCRWATMQKQIENRNTTHWITFGGITRTLKQTCRDLGITYPLAWRRIYREGWEVDRAIQQGLLRAQVRHK